MPAMRLILLVTLCLVLPGCSQKDQPAAGPAPGNSPSLNNATAPGVVTILHPTTLEASWAATVTSYKAGSSYGDNGLKGDACFEASVSGATFTRGNITATWTAQSPAAADLSIRLLPATGGDAMAEASGPSPLRLDFRLPHDYSTVRVGLRVPGNADAAAAITQSVDVAFSVLATEAGEIGTQARGIC